MCNFCKNKYYLSLFFVWIFFIQNPTNITNNKKIYIHEFNMFDIINDYAQNNKNIYVITKNSINFYLNMRGTKVPKSIRYEFLDTWRYNNLQNYVKNRIDSIQKHDKNAIIFTTFLKPDDNNSASDNYKCYYNTFSDCCVWKIENK